MDEAILPYIWAIFSWLTNYYIAPRGHAHVNFELLGGILDRMVICAAAIISVGS